jgi:hypothetical protein
MRRFLPLSEARGGNTANVDKLLLNVKNPLCCGIQRFARDVDFGNGVLMWEPSRLHLEHGVSELEEAYFMCYTYYTQTWHLFDVGDEARR